MGRILYTPLPFHLLGCVVVPGNNYIMCDSPILAEILLKRETVWWMEKQEGGRKSRERYVVYRVK